VAVEGRILHDPERWALRFTWLGNLVNAILTPVAIPMLSLLRTGSSRRNAPAVTESDLRTWVEEGSPSQGSLEQGERKMIYSIFRFGETLAREIMVPRIDILALDVSTPLSEAVEAIAESGHSRIPVYEETVDNTIGLLFAKDLLRVERGPGALISSVRSLLRPVYYVPEAKKVDELLNEMQLRHVHMALVVDEYGGIAGLLTLEDILEEIIGEVQDEYDQAEEMLYQEVTPDEYIFQGRIDLGDFNDVMGSRLTKNFSELTLAGEGAEGRMSGFYFAGGDQHLDHDTQQNHLAPHTTSDLLFKGALVGRSHSVWQGMIYVAPGAQKTDGYQANRNLVLSDQARADSIPGLEILADDVRCTHGATAVSYTHLTLPTN
jgi:Mg2+/Co2+ transporter CorC